MNRVGRVLTDLINRLVKPAGFKRAGNQWVIETDEGVGAINLQKSDYSNAYYVNLALSPRAILPDKIPQWAAFGIYGRATQLSGCSLLEGILKFSKDAQAVDEKTADAIRSCFSECLLPFITSHLTLRSLREFLETDLARHFLTSKQMREYFAEKV